MESKEELRSRLKKFRDSLASDERAAADAAVAGQVESLPEFAGARLVFTYLSVGTEVDTRELIRSAWRQGKGVAVPRCVPGARRMTWHRIEGFDDLESGAFGIEEPPDDASTLVDVPGPDASCAAVALVPGFSFDACGYRVGYGGGFYDVFLPTFGGMSIGLCRDCQFSESRIPSDSHDVPVGIVVTETRVERTRRP